MSRLTDALYFDPADHELVELISKRIQAGGRTEKLDPLFDPYLHPRGIKELAAPIQKRIAHAVIQLLSTLEAGQADERIAALRSLQGEVFMGCHSSLRHNTARVLLSTMKALIGECRAGSAPEKQLQLAHDFFAALSGRPAVIRRQLERFHLLEMPEDWNQVAFDHHVHDANSKGRKSPTHLITDAWIKGIRDLNVIYYGFIEPEAASELTEAAEILGVKLRVGIELPARFHDKYAQFIWAPRGFDGREDFLEFLQSEAVQRFFDKGRALAENRKRATLAMLESFNAHHRLDLNARFHVELPPLCASKFLSFVGVGQPSITHLSEYLHAELLPLLSRRAETLKVARTAGVYPSATSAQAFEGSAALALAEEAPPLAPGDIDAELESIDRLLPDQLLREYFRAELNPDVPNARTPTDDPLAPELLRQSPVELARQLQQIHAGYRLTLNPTGLTAPDVLELLYDLEGAITHVEIYNLKDRQNGHVAFGPQLMRLRRALGDSNPSALQQAVRDILSSDEATRLDEARRGKLHRILLDIPRFLGFYRSTPLKCRIGSDSIGRAGALFGMGLAVRSTLPGSVQRRLNRKGEATVLPVRIEAVPVTRWLPRTSLSPALDRLYARGRERRWPRWFCYRRVEAFETLENETRNDERGGNVITLGGVDPRPSNGLLGAERAPEKRTSRFLNTRWKNVLKILLGFLPAFLTFALTKDWWLLTWFGALIWFGITGLRNILQSVVSMGGLFFRSPFIKWNDLVSWSRVSDSLLYTGISVPLLDWLVKGQLLDQGFGVTTQTSPVLLYTAMSVVNGLYIAAHNTYRGFPRSAVIGNLFRALFAIPLALAINALVLKILLLRGWSALEANAMLQLWAAIFSKIASDFVAALIEGAADRSQSLRLRRHDYRAKLEQIFDIHGQLEMSFPESDVLKLIATDAPELALAGPKVQLELRRLILSALDLLYFWMYQPRARLAVRQLLAGYSPEERAVLLGTQRILERKRQISLMFIDQLVGGKFDRALACYLERRTAYLKEFEAMVSAMSPVAPPTAAPTGTPTALPGAAA